MIRVLVAEDELPILRGIKNMIEKINPEFQVIKCASNGRDAIEFLKDHPVDAIFTDINMPLVDGLELLKYVATAYPQCINVIISGYGEFHYAQQAIHLGVKEYLLKPIVYEDLVKILKNIQTEIELEKGNEQKNLLKSAVYEGRKNEGKQEVQIVYFCAGPLIKEGLEEIVEECNFWKGMDLERTALQFLPEKSNVYVFEKYQANEKIMLVVSYEEICMKSFCTKIVEAGKSNKVCITAICHQEKIGLQDIPSVSRKLRKNMQENILLGESSVFEDVEFLKGNDSEGQNLFSHSFIGNGNAILKEAELVFCNELLKQKDAVYLLERLFKEFFPSANDDTEENEDTIWNLILYSSDGKELYENLIRILTEKGISENQESTERLMKRVEQYIHEHLSEGITVAAIAQNFGLVPPYLSRLFKEYSGYTLSQYVQKIRIERAKTLLEMDEEVLAKDVAEIVGYPNPLYFSKMFKKKVGVYPSEYRKQVKK